MAKLEVSALYFLRARQLIHVVKANHTSAAAEQDWMQLTTAGRWLLAFALACILICGCGQGGPTLYPVEGQVFFIDKPATGAQVVFHPAGGSESGTLTSSGTVAADASFRLSTYPHGDGAPQGDYDVLVTWFPENARELDNPQNKLPAKYGTQGSGVLKATVKAGKNRLEPFRLTP